MGHAPPIGRRPRSREGTGPSVPRGGRAQPAAASGLSLRGAESPGGIPCSGIPGRNWKFLLSRAGGGKRNGDLNSSKRLRKNETELQFHKGYDRETVAEIGDPHKAVSRDNGKDYIFR